MYVASSDPEGIFKSLGFSEPSSTQILMEACNGGVSSSPEKAEEEAARWVALEKLPTHERLRTSILMTGQKSCRQLVYKYVDVRKLTENDREDFIRRNFNVADDDNEKFLERLRDRFDRSVLFILSCSFSFHGFMSSLTCASLS